MKSTTVILLAAALLTTSAPSLWAEDWKTTDGKVYQDVKVIDSKPDAVTILHHDGGALVPLASLPLDVQKRFGYDPAKAKAAADARVKDDAANAKALQAEMNQASQMRQAGPEPQDTNAAETTSSSAHDANASSTTPVSRDPSHHTMDEFAASAGSLKSDPSDTTHYTMDQLAASASSLKSDPSDTTHYTMDQLAASASSLRRDLSDPTYSTMAHLARTMHSLDPDPSDPTHHTISEIADSGL